MKRTFNYTVTADYDNCNLLYFLKDHGYSSSVIVALKRTENGMQVNGEWTTVRHILKEGDKVNILIAEQEVSDNIVPTPLPLDIIYEDEDLMVINKPSDMPIHPSQGNYDNTLANAVAYYFSSKNEQFTYRCINRLDRDTTGLLILAKHMYSASLLSNMVKDRKISRQYLAIAEGCVPKSGVIDAPIARATDSTIERCVDYENGETAITNFECIKTFDNLSLVSLRLETGRTHQIRVHMKHIGHPLLGDFLYNPVFDKIKRQALHSYRLSFQHPITHQQMDFTTPLPEDMAILINGSNPLR